jgi:uncharacterized protein (TIGR02246 family)
MDSETGTESAIEAAPEGAATIEQLLARYVHGVDDRRFDDVGRLFAPDAELVVGRHTFAGRDAIVATLQAAAATSEPGKHVCANIDIDIDIDGERATVASDFVMILADRSVGSAGRYDDELTRLDGRWRFAARRIRVTIR